MLTRKDVAMMLFDELRDNNYHGSRGELATAQLAEICGMVDMAQKIMQRLEEDDDGPKVLYGDA